MKMQPVRVSDIYVGDFLLGPMYNADMDENTEELALCEFMKVTSCEPCETDDTLVALTIEHHETPMLYNKEKILVKLVQTIECEEL